MELEKLPVEFVINDELLDLEWINSLDSEQRYFDSLEKTFQSVDFSLDIDEINNLVSNLPPNQNKSADKIEETASKEFALICNPFYLYELEEEILELDASFDY